MTQRSKGVTSLLGVEYYVTRGFLRSIFFYRERNDSSRIIYRFSLFPVDPRIGSVFADLMGSTRELLLGEKKRASTENESEVIFTPGEITIFSKFRFYGT